ncbi:MAG: sigma-70 family RNA polymerase sigma factor, partial [Propionicimonas sp.]|nr:sigma-70 family RNA polymerase sigma factor [Propionicimonas sp.]
MARGTAQASVPHQREQRTAALFTTLQASTDPQQIARLTEELVAVNLPLCDALANRYTARGSDLDDLIQVARTALLLAIRRFQPGEDQSFAAFAVPTITGELKRHFRDYGWMIRPPRRLQELRSHVARTLPGLEQERGHTIGIAELSAHLGVTARQLEESLASSAGYRALSLDAPISQGAPASLGDTLGWEADPIEALVDQLDLRRALRALSRRD